MFTLILTERFRRDMDQLPNDATRQQVQRRIEQLAENPRHPGLQSHEIHDLPGGRTILEIYVNKGSTGRRIFWEYGENHSIRLWHIVDHDEISTSGLYLPRADDNEEIYEPESGKGQQALQPQIDRPAPVVSKGLFDHLSDNQLRQIGIPVLQIHELRQVRSESQLETLSVPEDVHNTLYEILTNPDQALNRMFDLSYLRYHSTAEEVAGYLEGRIRRLLLNLEPEQERLVDLQVKGPMLIKGVAGSGKTTIGLYRARALSRGNLFGESARVLFLTYTRTLTRALLDLFVDLYGEKPEHVEFASVMDWIGEYVGDVGTLIESKYRTAILKALAQDWKNSQRLSALPKYLYGPALGEEFDYIRARGVSSLEAYLDLKRSGRGSAPARQEGLVC